MIVLNPRSLVNKITEFHSFLRDHSIHIACVSESWTNNKHSDAYLCPPDFIVYRKDRNYSSGGGVCVFVSRLIPSIKVSFDSNNPYEIIAVDLFSENKPLCRIINVYTPPCYTASYEYIV